MTLTAESSSVNPGLRSFWRSDTALLMCIAFAGFAVHAAFANNYGYFRDELYYIVSGEHLQLGYVDFPPLIAYVAALLNVIASDSLFSIHVVSGLVDACLIFVSGLIARELGGKRLAQGFTATATLFSATLAFGAIFSMDIFDALWWSLLAFILIRIIKTDRPKLWILFGIVAGIGLNTKLTIAFFVLAIAAGLALTPARKYFRTKWLWFGGAISLASLVPYITWNALNGWPTIDFYIRHGGLNGSGPVSFIAYQFLITNPASFPLVILGLCFFLRTKMGNKYKVLALSFLILYVVFAVTNAKPYFLSPAYPMLFAGAALLFENSLISKRHSWIQKSYLGIIVVSGILLAPLFMPILPPATYASTYGSLTGAANGAAAQQSVGIFPQYLGDRFGWNTMTATVAQVYYSLPPQEKAQACIFTENYGEASALTFLGEKDGLPHVISGHNNFFIWGPGSCSGLVMITVGISLDQINQTYSSITQAALIKCSYCEGEENNLPVYVATDPRAPVQNIWPQVKHFN